MTLTQLRIFVAVAEMGHVTRGAETLGVTQAAASAAIASLERQYEVHLFDRVGRSIVLSDAGQLFLSEAQSIVEQAEKAQRTLRQLGGETIGHIEIAASQTIANYWLPRRLAAFHDRYPGIALNITITNTRDVENAVVTGEADVGFIEGSIQAANLNQVIVDHDQLVLVATPRLARLVARRGSPLDLTAFSWVIRETGSGTREMLELLAKQSDLRWDDLTIALELPSNEAVREAVEAGVGATLISRHVVASAIQAGILEALPVDVPLRSYYMVNRAGNMTSQAQTALIQSMQPKTPSEFQPAEA